MCELIFTVQISHMKYLVNERRDLEQPDLVWGILVGKTSLSIKCFK